MQKKFAKPCRLIFCMQSCHFIIHTLWAIYEDMISFSAFPLLDYFFRLTSFSFCFLRALRAHLAAVHLAIL